jgi:hypothetical protein
VTAPGSGEATGCVDLSSRPPGTRLILRKERPHPGAQLRITDADGPRITGFLTNTTLGGPGHQLADLELRHRRHARVEDRIRAAKDTGLRNLPLHDAHQNRIWLAITAFAADLLACLDRAPGPDHQPRNYDRSTTPSPRSSPTNEDHSTTVRNIEARGPDERWFGLLTNT